MNISKQNYQFKTFFWISMVGFILKNHSADSSAKFVQTIRTTTQLGTLEGIRVKTEYPIRSTVTNTYDVYRGVPYAQPPTLHRRFQGPEPVQAWLGVRDATKYAPVCPQNRLIWVKPDWPMNEDCLYLSIYTPHMESEPNNTYPVVVYIHGGSYEVGTERLYDGGLLSLHGLVTVFINYRLGILGFLSSGEGTVKGNYGLLDQIQALKWTQQFISHFGGDPQQVTIMGQSVGSSSVGLLLASPLAQGLYHRAIMQSGAVLARYSYQSNSSSDMNITKHFIQVGRAHNCPLVTSTGAKIEADGFMFDHEPEGLYDNVSIDAIHDCLRNISWARLLYDRNFLPRNDPVIPEFRPLIDGEVLPESPLDILTRTDPKHGQILERVPILQGTVKDEMSPYEYWDEPVKDSPYGMALASQVDSIFGYVRQLVGEDLVAVVMNMYSEWSANNGLVLKLSKIIEDIDFVVPAVKLSYRLCDIYPVYHYYFSASPISYHLVDLNYVFGSPFSGQNYDDNHGKFDYNESDRILSETMMELWSNFVKTGRPFINTTQFPAFSMDKKQYIDINIKDITIGTDIKAQTMQFWTKVLPGLQDKLDSKKVRSTNNQLNNSFSTKLSQQECQDVVKNHSKMYIVSLCLLSGLLCISFIVFLACIIWSCRGKTYVIKENTAKI